VLKCKQNSFNHLAVILFIVLSVGETRNDFAIGKKGLISTGAPFVFLVSHSGKVILMFLNSNYLATQDN